MATITLEYDGRNTIFTKLIDIFVQMGGKVVSKNQSTKLTAVQKSLQEAAEGKINSYNSVDEMFESILGKDYVQSNNH